MAKKLVHEDIPLLKWYRQARPGLEKEKENYFCAVLARASAMRVKETAHVKRGCKTGGKNVDNPARAKKHKSTSALAGAAGNRAMKALAAKRKSKEAEEDADELDEIEEEIQEEEEDQGEEEEGERRGHLKEHESQGAESQGEPQKRRRPRSKVLIAALPLHSSMLPDVICDSAR